MVDRGRSPIRPTPSHSTPREEVTDPVDAEHALDIGTSSLAERELARLLEEDELDFGSTTVQINARELDVLLEKARPEPARAVPEPPPSRPLLTTQPYDEVTAYVLLDKDVASSEPSEAIDEAPGLDDVVEADEVVEPAPSAPMAEAAVAAPAAVIVPAAEPSAPASQSIPPAGPPSASPLASAPSPAAISPSPARPSLPSAGTEWPGANARQRRSKMVVAMVFVLAAIGLLYLALTEPDPAPAALTPAAVTEPAPPPPAPIAPKPQSLAEVDARAALARLRDGMGDCVRRAIGSLPGSSPAVPASMKQTMGVGYTAAPADWKTAVWSCARFRHDAPMQFQLQWQSTKPGIEALGLAWVDDDGDGEADRAFGFRATAKGAHDVELGDVGPMEMRPALPVH